MQGECYEEVSINYCCICINPITDAWPALWNATVPDHPRVATEFRKLVYRILYPELRLV